MRTGPDRKVIFALLGIAALCVIGLGFSLYRGKVAQLSSMRNTLGARREQLTTLQDKLGRQDELEQKHADLQARVALLEPGLPDSAYMPTFLRQIEGLATSTHNQIVMIRPKHETTEAKKNVTVNDETGEVSSAKSGEGGSPGDKNAAGAKKDEKSQPKLPYDKMDIEVKIQGTYWSVIDFLSALQRFRKMIAVNDLSFTPERAARGETSSSNLSATLALTAVITKEGKG